MTQDQQYHTIFHLTELSTPPGVMVPQLVYSTPGQRDWRPLPPLTFQTSSGLGVRLKDALDGSMPRLSNGRTAPTLSRTSARTTVRILWPGYEAWGDQNAVNLFDHTTEANPQTLEKIVQKLAKIVQKFYNDMSHSNSSNPDWKLQKYPLSNIYILQLRNVSAGSWQPVISVDL